MLLKRIPVTKINPAPYNPRKDLQPGDPEYEKIARSIDEFGCVEPLVWNKRTGTLVGGHQRLKVLIARGAKQVHVSVVDLPVEREKALNGSKSTAHEKPREGGVCGHDGASSCVRPSPNSAQSSGRMPLQTTMITAQIAPRDPAPHPAADSDLCGAYAVSGLPEVATTRGLPADLYENGDPQMGVAV